MGGKLPYSNCLLSWYDICKTLTSLNLAFWDIYYILDHKIVRSTKINTVTPVSQSIQISNLYWVCYSIISNLITYLCCTDGKFSCNKLIISERAFMVKTDCCDNLKSKNLPIIFAEVICTHFWDCIWWHRIKWGFFS